MLQEDGGGDETPIYNNNRVRITERDTRIIATIFNTIPDSPVAAMQVVMYLNPESHQHPNERSFYVLAILRGKKKLPYLQGADMLSGNEELEHREFIDKRLRQPEEALPYSVTRLLSSDMGELVEDSTRLLVITNQLVQKKLISKSMEAVITLMTMDEKLLHKDPWIQKMRLMDMLPPDIKQSSPQREGI